MCRTRSHDCRGVELCRDGWMIPVLVGYRWLPTPLRFFPSIGRTLRIRDNNLSQGIEKCAQITARHEIATQVKNLLHKSVVGSARSQCPSLDCGRLQAITHGVASIVQASSGDYLRLLRRLESALRRRRSVGESGLPVPPMVSLRQHLCR